MICRAEEAEQLRAAAAAHVATDAKPVVFFVPGYMGSRLIVDGVVAFDMEVRWVPCDCRRSLISRAPHGHEAGNAVCASVRCLSCRGVIIKVHCGCTEVRTIPAKLWLQLNRHACSARAAPYARHNYWLNCRGSMWTVDGLSDTAWHQGSPETEGVKFGGRSACRPCWRERCFRRRMLSRS